MQHYLDILDQREGWGRDTTGGRYGPVVTVTTLADAGPGSLREALEAPGPAWIRFAVDGTINALSSIFPQPFKTIDARGRAINLKGPGGGNYNINPLRIWHTHNIIILNLKMDDAWPNYGADSEGADAINLKDCWNIWIHHCHLERWTDGLVDAIGPNVDRVTISRCNLYNNWQACALEAARATFCKNWCRTVGARAPKAIGGLVHSYNNLLQEWGLASIQGATKNGQLLAEWNIMWPGALASFNDIATGGKIHTSNYLGVNPTIKLGGNDTLDAQLVSASRAMAGVAFTPEGVGMYKPADASQWNPGLINSVRNKAGVS